MLVKLCVCVNRCMYALQYLKPDYVLDFLPFCHESYTRMPPNSKRLCKKFFLTILFTFWIFARRLLSRLSFDLCFFILQTLFTWSTTTANGGKNIANIIIKIFHGISLDEYFRKFSSIFKPEIFFIHINLRSSCLFTYFFIETRL